MLWTVVVCSCVLVPAIYAHSCLSLLPGQYTCDLPVIDAFTQQPIGCNVSNLAPVVCTASEGILCSSGNATFLGSIPCFYSSGKDWRIALVLSIFFGWLGLDRFYLGYFAIGLLKLCTFGFFLLLHLVDVVLIALQIVGPADESEYRMEYYSSRPVSLQYWPNSTTVLL